MYPRLFSLQVTAPLCFGFFWSSYLALVFRSSSVAASGCVRKSVNSGHTSGLGSCGLSSAAMRRQRAPVTDTVTDAQRRHVDPAVAASRLGRLRDVNSVSFTHGYRLPPLRGSDHCRWRGEAPLTFRRLSLHAATGIATVG